MLRRRRRASLASKTRAPRAAETSAMRQTPRGSPPSVWLRILTDMKSTVIVMLVGALAGIVAASFIVPPMLSWYTSPGGLPQGAAIPAVVQIPEVIRYATSRLMWGQAIGAGIGALLGLIVSRMFRRKPAPIG